MKIDASSIVNNSRLALVSSFIKYSILSDCLPHIICSLKGKEYLQKYPSPHPKTWLCPYAHRLSKHASVFLIPSYRWERKKDICKLLGVHVSPKEWSQVLQAQEQMSTTSLKLFWVKKNQKNKTKTHFLYDQLPV
jgi:hypothetical protein